MLLKTLTESAGVSGQEGEVRQAIREALNGRVDELRTDALGNLIAAKGAGEKRPRVMLAAHMDEVGLMVSSIEKSGLLRFKRIGSIDERVLVSKVVFVGKDKVPGVTGAKPIHLQEPEERERPIPIDQLYIDIGARSKEEAEKAVKPGDVAVFATTYEEFAPNRAKAKAFDDRIGCAVVIEVLQQAGGLQVYGAFTVQEEVGARGAGVAAYSIEPDLALVFEGTTASDVPESLPEGYCTTLGEGPALTIMDSSVIASKAIIQRLIEVARRANIPVQFRRTSAGGTDAGRIHLQREGIPTAVISVPTRYIHSPVSEIDLRDFENAKRLTLTFLESLSKEGISF